MERRDSPGSPNRVRLWWGDRSVTEAVVDVMGSDRVGVPPSPSGTFNSTADSNPKETFGYAIQALNRFNLAYLHLVEPMEADVRHGGTPIPTSEFRPLFNGTLITCGGFTKETANQVLAAGGADLIAFGQLYIANPDLVKRFRHGATLNAPDSSTFYGGDTHGYTDYPTLAEQHAA